MGKKLDASEVQRRIRNGFIQNVEMISDYHNRRSEITLKCKDCGHVWDVVAQTVLYTNKKAIQHHCPNCTTTNKLGITTKCAYCDKVIYRTPH